MTDVHWVQVGSQYFAGGDGSVGLFIESVRGLDELPDARASLDRVPQAHGSFEPTSVWRDSLAITVSGTIHGEDRADAERRRDVLKNELAGMLDMRFSDTTGIWNMRVRVDNVRPADMGAWSSMIPFTIDMIAPDPVRYRDPVMLGPVGLPVRSGGLRLPERFPWHFGTSIMPVLKLVNGGTRPTFPIVTVTGAGSALTVTCGPRRIEFGAWSGEFVIDNRDRRAFLNGADVTRGLIRREWQEIPAGGSWDLTYDVADADPATQMFATYQEGAW